MRYNAVIFDLFGTLVESVRPEDYKLMLGELADAMNVPLDDLIGQWRATLEHRESGRMGSLHDLLQTTARAAGGSPTPSQVEEAGRRWLRIARNWLTPRSDARPTLESLRASGLKIALLSNCSAEVPVIWPDFGLSDLFDVPGFSCNIGFMKPDPKIYESVYGELNVEPGRCLYVGDGGARELTGASAVGMDAILLRVKGEEHTWFDSYYRQDALEWDGPTITSLTELPSLAGTHPR